MANRPVTRETVLQQDIHLAGKYSDQQLLQLPTSNATVFSSGIVCPVEQGAQKGRFLWKRGRKKVNAFAKVAGLLGKMGGAKGDGGLMGGPLKGLGGAQPPSSAASSPKAAGAAKADGVATVDGGAAGAKN